MRTKKPIRVFYSELSQRFYAARAYRIKRDGDRELVTVTGDKFDVTDDIASAIKAHDLEFTPLTQKERT